MEFLVKLFECLGLVAGILFFAYIILAIIFVSICNVYELKEKKKIDNALNEIVDKIIKEAIKENKNKKTQPKPEPKFATEVNKNKKGD